MNQKTYCLDTSALLFMADIYSADMFPEVWDQLAQLVADDMVIAPREVHRELAKKDDNGALSWVKAHKSLLQPLDTDQAGVATEIMNSPQLLGLIDLDSELPDADPFVFALAAARQYATDIFGSPIEVAVVATRSSAQRVGLEDVCRTDGLSDYGVQFLTPYQLLIDIGQDVPEPGEIGLAGLYGIWEGADYTEEEIEAVKVKTRGTTV